MLVAEGLTKKFRIYSRPSDRVKEAFHFGRRRYHSEFTAVDRVSLEVHGGETVAIVGQNGSGKSTLLKLLARLMVPSGGSLATEGRISSIIELGTGFHPEFTGRSNIYLTASLMGFEREEIDAMVPAVTDFSELGEFIDRPVKTYSSGMWVRLAFSVAVAVNPEILLIDEALSVGDMLFQQKCVARLRQFQQAGVCIVFVSHDLGAVKTLCDRAILLDHGRKISEGTPEGVCDEYISLMAAKASDRPILSKAGGPHRRYGSYEAEIMSAVLMDAKGRGTSTLVSGETATIQVRVGRRSALTSPTVGILIRDRLGNEVFGTNTSLAGLVLSTETPEFLVNFDLTMTLGPRNYYVTVAVHAGRDHLGVCYDWIDNLIAFEVLPGDHEFAGYCDLHARVSVFPVPAELEDD
jgi:lipopolysaccharide transport system ATP-binding protein